MKDNKLIKKIESTIISILKKEGGASGLKPIKKAVDNLDKPEKFNLVKHLSKMSNVKKHKNSDYILTPINEKDDAAMKKSALGMAMYGKKAKMKESNLREMIRETIFETMNEGLCAKGKAYIRKRKAAGEKSSAYLSGRAVKVCKGQMKG